MLARFSGRPNRLCHRALAQRYCYGRKCSMTRRVGVCNLPLKKAVAGLLHFARWLHADNHQLLRYALSCIRAHRVHACIFSRVVVAARLSSVSYFSEIAGLQTTRPRTGCCPDSPCCTAGLAAVWSGSCRSPSCGSAPCARWRWRRPSAVVARKTRSYSCKAGSHRTALVLYLVAAPAAGS